MNMLLLISFSRKIIKENHTLLTSTHLFICSFFLQKKKKIFKSGFQSPFPIPLLPISPKTTSPKLFSRPLMISTLLNLKASSHLPWPVNSLWRGWPPPPPWQPSTVLPGPCHSLCVPGWFFLFSPSSSCWNVPVLSPWSSLFTTLTHLAISCRLKVLNAMHVPLHASSQLATWYLHLEV